MLRIEELQSPFNKFWIRTVTACFLVVALSVVCGHPGLHVWSVVDPGQNPCLSELCPPPYQCFNLHPYERSCFLPSIGVTLVDQGVNILSTFNVKVWLEAGDLNGNSVPDVDEGHYPNGGLVSTWKSKVGDITMNALSGTPTLDPSTMGGKPSVHFARTGQYLMKSSLDLTLDHDFSVFLAIEVINNAATNQMVLEYGICCSPTSPDRFGFLENHATLSLDLFRAAVGGSYTLPAWKSSPKDTPRLGVIYSDGTSFYGRTNGAADATVAKPGSVASGTSRLHLGGRHDGTNGNNWFDGYIAEVIIIDGILSLSDVQIVENYLKTKYSIS